MSQNTRESLSVLMDGESDELELRRVLKSLPKDDDAADTWRRYHLARSMMQRERGVDVSIDLSAGVMARLRDEPAPSVQNTEHVANRTGGISFARGASVAAAVSLMVITGVQFFGNDASVSQSGGDVAASASGANGAAQVQPVNLASQPAVTSRTEMPMFEQTPFRLSGQSAQSGLMNISESGFSAQSSQGVTAQQGTSIDVDQIGMLQSYLEQHTQGAAYGSGDSWMPLMRSSAVTEPLGQR
ncbi:sigma-E factor negative regulatory protein [Halovibrio sp. HP20-50]|uniref:sigma-E factor negative regulatory protein n=1 Tax=Halovibrio sp. HP20-59 TaxID=3080275 RepID=UPI00294B99A6|nr:sigma-E factor negative regulatory protein [Halovibrio sp. HP20-59]MEA2118445.1 sigma-E factor negative regulatory protein [Halovibrio sp. HP20-59]